MSDCDICLTCGKQFFAEGLPAWGHPCCDPHNTVHLETCTICDNPLGLINDDDYVGPEKIVCTTCIRKAMQL